MNPELERKGWKCVVLWTKEDSAVSEALFKNGVEVTEYAVFDHDPIEKAYELGRKEERVWIIKYLTEIGEAEGAQTLAYSWGLIETYRKNNKI
jgi:hypothetical protein